MSKTRKYKEKKVEEIKEKFERASSTIITDFRGLNVADITELRRKLREEGIEYKVLKNTLTRFALEKVGLEELISYIEGPTAVVFGYDDPITPARLIVSYAEDNENLKLKVGFLEGNVINIERLKELSKLPSVEILRSKVAGAFQAPLAGLVNISQAPIRNLVYLIEALRQQKEAEEGA